MLAMNSEPIPRSSRFQPGDQLYFFSKPDPTAQISALIGSMQATLAKGQRAICVVEGLTVAELAKRLAQAGIDVEGARTQGRLKLWTRQEWSRTWDELLRNEAAHIATRVARAKIEKMLDGVGEGCVALDAEGRVTYANESAARRRTDRGKILAGISRRVARPIRAGLQMCLGRTNHGRVRQRVSAGRSLDRGQGVSPLHARAGPLFSRHHRTETGGRDAGRVAAQL